MVSTRRHTPKAANNAATTEEEEWALLAAQAEEDVNAEDGTPSKSSKKKSKRQQAKEELKSKNTGVGLKISINNESKGKKIVFDDESIPPVPVAELSEEVLDNNEQEAEDDDDDDDDDAIEEVQGSKARQEIETLLETEEKATKKKKKRKRKERKNDEEDDLDEDFFSELETLRHKEAEEQRKAAAKAKGGKHTTFVFSQDDNEDATVSEPAVQVSENMEVVVLGNKNKGSTAAIITKEAMLLSRNLLQDGSDDAVENRRGGNRDSKKRKLANQETSWKRSRKSSTIRRIGKGRPALLFSRKKKG